MDIASFFNPITASADYALAQGALRSDADLQTAVIISLFTDRRAEPDDVLPSADAARRGWWGDALAAESGLGVGRIGSRLWLLGREKILPETVTRAREYAQEALAWMTAQGVAKQVTVSAKAVSADGLFLGVEIRRNQGQSVRYRFDLAWQQIRS